MQFKIHHITCKVQRCKSKSTPPAGTTSTTDAKGNSKSTTPPAVSFSRTKVKVQAPLPQSIQNPHSTCTKSTQHLQGQKYRFAKAIKAIQYKVQASLPKTIQNPHCTCRDKSTALQKPQLQQSHPRNGGKLFNVKLISTDM